MELGMTFPLQRFVKRKTPACGVEPDRRFCWDLHVIDLRGRKCLLAVHCHSRYTFLRYDVAPVQWADLPGLFREGLTESLAAGFAAGQIEDYLRRAGSIQVARTHGRREVAFLNRAWEDVLTMDLCLDTNHQGAAPAGPRSQHPAGAVRGLCGAGNPDWIGCGLPVTAPGDQSQRPP